MTPSNLFHHSQEDGEMEEFSNLCHSRRKCESNFSLLSLTLPLSVSLFETRGSERGKERRGREKKSERMRRGRSMLRKNKEKRVTNEKVRIREIENKWEGESFRKGGKEIEGRKGG
jgi:hypothetical protein